jgi:hypothetical protein
VAKKSVKEALNLQDLLRLIIFICIIYLYAILVRYRLLGLLLGYIKRERGVFKSFYLIDPFALYGGPSLLFGSFASIYYRLKSGQVYKKVIERITGL